MATEHRETVQRRYYAVTGEMADEAMVENLISTGESERFLEKAIQQQGRGQERHNAVTVIEGNLKELHEVFMDMAVLVESQGEQLDDIESHVKRASSFVRGGTEELQVARNTQKNTRKWTYFGVLLLLIIIAIIVLSIRPWK
ncbi:hypothetical protein OSB04_027933 [Centaurea solstitialis]|uniref:t-SNARE coiled-coil homology domain-containing protein n=1 Tax=Centaurea solstitialis TaxID=347529 RepID=A0AA38W056_9ASTR|nr:hypothetical protein OSB04_027933 [Centaurea solstitialis]